MAYSPWIGNLVVGGTPGNYGTVKLLLDETDPAEHGFAVRVEIARQQLDPSAFDVEVFTNLNRRDFARISEPLDQSGRADSYWIVSPDAARRRVVRQPGLRGEASVQQMRCVSSHHALSAAWLRHLVVA